MKKLSFIFVAILSLAACTSYQTIPVTLPDGFTVQAKVADTPYKQERGLMEVTQLPEDKGMIFLFDKEDEQLFWMKDTFIDLDIIFIGTDKIVTSLSADTPRSTRNTPEYAVAIAPGYGQYVLELVAGTAAKHGVTPGAKINF